MASWQMRWWDFLLNRCQQQTPLHQQALIDILSDSRSPLKGIPVVLDGCKENLSKSCQCDSFHDKWKWNEAKAHVQFSKSPSKMNNWKSDIHIPLKLYLYLI